MQKLMNEYYDPDNANVNSGVDVLKILKLLPEDVMYLIVHKIANNLQNRSAIICDQARMALSACLKELGVEYLIGIVNILRAILNQGSEVVYTLNFILSKCLPNPTFGKLDHCLVDLLDVVVTDILGEEDFASRIKCLPNHTFGKLEYHCLAYQTRKQKSFETLKLIAENVTFRSHGLTLLSPVTAAQLQLPLPPKIKTNLEKMLKQIAAGIEGNPSVDQGDLFDFIYARVKNGLEDQVSSPPSKKRWKSRDLNETAGLIYGARSCPHIVTVFALDLLHNRLKKLRLDNIDKEELLSKLDPFVRLLTGCLSSKYEVIVSLSLRCFTSLIRFPLPSLMSEADEVKTTVLTIAQSVVSSSSPLVQSCFKLLASLFGYKIITLSSEQLTMLVQFPKFVDLESDPSFVALSLLEAIVQQKLVVPEIYDIAMQVSELMVKSQLDSVRKKCKQILLQFMVHYTLSGKHLDQHVNFLLRNMRYEYPTGRVVVLDMLHALILKFSEPNLGKQSFLDQKSKTLFLELGLCFSTDIDKEVQSRFCVVLELLIGRMSTDQLESSLLCCLSWYTQQNLWAIAAQVLVFFIDTMKKTFRKHIYNTVQYAKRILESAVSASSLQLQNTVEEGSLPFWKEAYYSLVMIEKMLEQFPDISFSKDLEDIWKMVFKFLMHPHAWLRNKSCQLLNRYFVALTGKKRAESQTLVANSLLEKPSSLFMVAVSLSFQLKDQSTRGNVDVDLLTENIVFVVSSLHSLIGQYDQAIHCGFWSSLDEDEQVVFLEAFEVLDSGKGKSTFLALTSGKGTENGEDDANDVRNVLIGSLLKRMGKLALDMESFRVVFNVYKAFASQMNREECCLYAYKILLPLYKVCEGFTGKIITDELKQLAEEVRDSIRDKSLGNKMFVEVYSEIRNSLRTKREKKLMTRVNKKRSMTSMKLSRWACS